jgi:hypothetical protein
VAAHDRAASGGALADEPFATSPAAVDPHEPEASPGIHQDVPAPEASPDAHQDAPAEAEAEPRVPPGVGASLPLAAFKAMVVAFYEAHDPAQVRGTSLVPPTPPP